MWDFVVGFAPQLQSPRHSPPFPAGFLRAAFPPAWYSPAAGPGPILWSPTRPAPMATAAQKGLQCLRVCVPIALSRHSWFTAGTFMCPWRERDTNTPYLVHLVPALIANPNPKPKPNPNPTSSQNETLASDFRPLWAIFGNGRPVLTAPGCFCLGCFWLPLSFSATFSLHFVISETRPNDGSSL